MMSSLQELRKKSNKELEIELDELVLRNINEIQKSGENDFKNLSIMSDLLNVFYTRYYRQLRIVAVYKKDKEEEIVNEFEDFEKKSEKDCQIKDDLVDLDIFFECLKKLKGFYQFYLLKFEEELKRKEENQNSRSANKEDDVQEYKLIIKDLYWERENNETKKELEALIDGVVSRKYREIKEELKEGGKDNYDKKPLIAEIISLLKEMDDRLLNLVDNEFLYDSLKNYGFCQNYMRIYYKRHYPHFYQSLDEEIDNKDYSEDNLCLYEVVKDSKQNTESEGNTDLFMQEYYTNTLKICAEYLAGISKNSKIAIKMMHMYYTEDMTIMFKLVEQNPNNEEVVFQFFDLGYLDFYMSKPDCRTADKVRVTPLKKNKEINKLDGTAESAPENEIPIRKSTTSGNRFPDYVPLFYLGKTEKQSSSLNKYKKDYEKIKILCRNILQNELSEDPVI